MGSVSFSILLGILFSSCVSISSQKAVGFLEEQSFFSGSYVQTHSYDDGQNVYLGGLNAGDIISFDLNARTHAVLGPSLSETDVDVNDLYSPAFDGHEFWKYDDSEYDAFVIDQDNMNGVAWGSGSGGETHFDLTSFVGYFSVRSVENE